MGSDKDIKFCDLLYKVIIIIIILVIIIIIVVIAIISICAAQSQSIKAFDCAYKIKSDNK